MTQISSRASLLHTAIQDLHAGKVDAAKRLPALADHARDPALAALLRDEADRAKRQAGRLAAAAGTDDPTNLWMEGILEDAERDTRQTEPGPLLDIALIGAVRKAKAAEIVSSETAIALAEALDDETLRTAVGANRAEEIEGDRGLKKLLVAIVQKTPGTNRFTPAA